MVENWTLESLMKTEHDRELCRCRGKRPREHVESKSLTNLSNQAFGNCNFTKKTRRISRSEQQ
jgi:hypothetical protein